MTSYPLNQYGQVPAGFYAEGGTPPEDYPAEWTPAQRERLAQRQHEQRFDEQRAKAAAQASGALTESESGRTADAIRRYLEGGTR